MRHWHVIERAAGRGKDRDVGPILVTAGEARETRDGLQQGSNLHRAGYRYGVRSCEARGCG